MQKTKKSVAKRFKISATGKLIRRTPGFRHLLAAKSTKSKRRASRDKLVAPGHAEAASPLPARSASVKQPKRNKP